MAVSDGNSFSKGEFLLEYRGVLKNAGDDMPHVDTYVYEFRYKGKHMWYVIKSVLLQFLVMFLRYSP